MNLDFQDIFNELLNILPSGWENAIFMAEYTSGSYSMRCINVMKMKGISKPQVIKTYKALNDIFQKERMELVESSWYAITLKFDKNGKFSSDFDYNSHEENVLEYLEQWEQKNVL